MASVLDALEVDLVGARVWFVALGDCLVFCGASAFPVPGEFSWIVANSFVTCLLKILAVSLGQVAKKPAWLYFSHAVSVGLNQAVWRYLTICLWVVQL